MNKPSSAIPGKKGVEEGGKAALGMQFSELFSLQPPKHPLALTGSPVCGAAAGVASCHQDWTASCAGLIQVACGSPPLLAFAGRMGKRLPTGSWWFKFKMLSSRTHLLGCSRPLQHIPQWYASRGALEGGSVGSCP